MCVCTYISMYVYGRAQGNEDHDNSSMLCTQILAAGCPCTLYLFYKRDMRSVMREFCLGGFGWSGILLQGKIICRSNFLCLVHAELRNVFAPRSTRSESFKRRERESV